MLLQDEVKLLRKLDLFSAVDTSRLRILAFASGRCHFDPSDVLFHEGDESFGAFIIMSGTVEVSTERDGIRGQKSGTPDGVAIVGQSSMLSDSTRKATVTAVTEVEALRIERESFVKLMASCPKCSAGIMGALGRQMSDDLGDRLEPALRRQG